MSKKKTSHHLDELAASAGFRWINADRRWHLRCSRCPEELSLHFPRNMSPDMLIKKARMKEWDAGFGAEPKCPEHIHHRPFRVIPGKNIRASLFDGSASMPTVEDAARGAEIRGIDQRIKELGVEIISIELEQAGETAEEDIMNDQASSAKLSRKVIGLLEAHFGEESGLYESGWDDARIARETCASEEFVSRTRSEAFRDLAEPPEITRFREDLIMVGLEREQL